MNLINILGFMAAGFTTIAYLPQVVKTYKSRSASDLSLGTFSMLTTGLLLWLIYGWLSHNQPIIFANLMTLMLAASLLYMKFKFKTR